MKQIMSYTVSMSFLLKLNIPSSIDRDILVRSVFLAMADLKVDSGFISSMVGLSVSFVCMVTGLSVVDILSVKGVGRVVIVVNAAVFVP